MPVDGGLEGTGSGRLRHMRRTVGISVHERASPCYKWDFIYIDGRFGSYWLGDYGIKAWSTESQELGILSSASNSSFPDRHRSSEFVCWSVATSRSSCPHIPRCLKSFELRRIALGSSQRCRAGKRTAARNTSQYIVVKRDSDAGLTGHGPQPYRSCCGYHAPAAVLITSGLRLSARHGFTRV